MKKGFLFLIACTVLSCSAFLFLPQEIDAATFQQNNCPIILAQSWTSETEGLNRIQAVLNAGGYDARTASVGPVSSAWDRACELYAQIKGGTVDYGEAHAKKFGHARYGRTYPALYPQWGITNAGALKPNMIHLIGYSFEGITARVLVELLENGSADEIAATKDGSLSPLFTGHHCWVLSCSAIASPHNGTTLLDRYLANGLDSSSTLRIMILLSEGIFDDTSVYDIDLDQWGFYNRPDESFNRLLSRLASKRFLNEKDFSYYDLTPKGIYALNTWVKSRPFVYYFSLSANAMTKGTLPVVNYFIPISSMTPDLKSYASFMGAYYLRLLGPVPIDGRWWPNDGLVNTVSEAGPQACANRIDTITAYYGYPISGTWNYMGIVNGADHFQVIDTTEYYDAVPWFLNFAKILYGLIPR